MLPALHAVAAAGGAAPAGPAARSFAQALAALRPAGAHEPAAIAPRGDPRATGSPPALEGPRADGGDVPAWLGAVDGARARLDGLLTRALAGRALGQGELLALQAEAYRTVQTLELTTRLVEQGGQAIKQALATPL